MALWGSLLRLLALACAWHATEGFLPHSPAPPQGLHSPRSTCTTTRPPGGGLGGGLGGVRMVDEDYEGDGAGLRALLSNSDRYKEDSRKFRRKVFNEEDWLDFRSSGRLYYNLKTMFTSGVIRGLWIEVGSVIVVATTCWLANILVLSGQLEPFNIPADGSFLFALPTLPFTLSSPALALLLVFRTNTVYARWNEARMAWAKIENHCINIARQGVNYLEEDQREEHIRRIIALAHITKRHFQADDGADEYLVEKLTSLLGKKESERMMAARGRPLQALLDIARVVRRSGVIDGSTKARFDLHMDEIHQALVTCERIRRNPVPLVYTRHTGRFLGLWILLLPFALVKELNESFIVIPTCGLVAVFFFGIEELGIQIEEPFSIMPLQDIVVCIERRLRRMLAYDATVREDPEIGADADPLTPATDHTDVKPFLSAKYKG